MVDLVTPELNNSKLTGKMHGQHLLGVWNLLKHIPGFQIMVSWRGIYFILTLFWGSFFGSIFMLGPFLPLMFINPSWYRWINNRIVATWLTLPVALLETMFGVKVIITGDAFVPGERSVIIMNHRTRMDWMFLWSCLMRYSYLRLEKICLKASLKSVPGFGWAMQAAAYIFIHRKWKDDRSHFEDMIDYFCDIHEPLQLLIFPEGTDLTESTTARSNDFAEKNGLQKYEYVLHPRTTGFTFVVDRLREVFLLRVSASEILLMRPSLQPCASLYLLTSGEKSCSGAMYYLTPASWCER
ncbi:lysocardiolipin acyltransferase 1 isoform X3 [Camelus dromedarius]